MLDKRVCKIACFIISRFSAASVNAASFPLSSSASLLSNLFFRSFDAWPTTLVSELRTPPKQHSRNTMITINPIATFFRACETYCSIGKRHLPSSVYVKPWWQPSGLQLSLVSHTAQPGVHLSQCISVKSVKARDGSTWGTPHFRTHLAWQMSSGVRVAYGQSAGQDCAKPFKPSSPGSFVRWSSPHCLSSNLRHAAFPNSKSSMPAVKGLVAAPCGDIPPHLSPCPLLQREGKMCSSWQARTA
mmetsp:Transcript_70751/g.134732  ORF Transcript_70751/g.134732 Transcript_70751/m.134732 type:complete len:244 (-) Transcript_70751:8-739(-)